MIPPLTLDEALTFKRKIEDDLISRFINESSTIGNLSFQMLKEMLDNDTKRDLLNVQNDDHILTAMVHNNTPIEVEPENNFNINANLHEDNVKNWFRFFENINKLYT